MAYSPQFGSADITNCERELIHLAGSIQPHGHLVVFRGPEWRIVQVSANLAEVLGRPLEDILGMTLDQLGPGVAAPVKAAAEAATTETTVPVRLWLDCGVGGGEFEGMVHWVDRDVVLEFETVAGTGPRDAAGRDLIPRFLRRAAAKLKEAASPSALFDATVRSFRQLTGYDRVMVYRFDVHGHGEVVAESRRPDLEPFLGLHYPSSDIPQRARALYLQNRVRLLVDVRYTPSPLVPNIEPGRGGPLDMSLCYLRSMSPLHLQYLQNMGVTGTLVSSLVRDGQLWGLVACHHYEPKRTPYEIRAACEVLCEIFAARLATLERQAQAETEESVRRLQATVIEAVSTTGDWRPALFAAPRNLLSLVGATGAALVYDREVMTAGQVPATPDILELVAWIGRRAAGRLFETSALRRDNPRLEHLTPIASGVLAVSLSDQRDDFLLWFRKEQPLTVAWAGDPRKPMVGNDPLHLSPRRSFAIWKEAVRGTAVPWSPMEKATANAFRSQLSEIVLQIQAVRALITHHQLNLVSQMVERGWEPALVARPSGDILVANQAFYRLMGVEPGSIRTLADAALCFTDETGFPMASLLTDRAGWSGELTALRPDGSVVPVAVKADVVHTETGGVMGFVVLVSDLTDRKRADLARQGLVGVIENARDPELEARLDTRTRKDLAEMMNAILANASEAASVVDGATLTYLEDIQSLTKRAAILTRQIISHSANSRRKT